MRHIDRTLRTLTWLVSALSLQMLLACSEQSSSSGKPMSGAPAASEPAVATPTPASAPVLSVDSSNPCALLSQADAAEVFGEPAFGDGPSYGDCWWQSKTNLKSVKIATDTASDDEWKAGYQNRSWVRYDAFDEGYRSLVLANIVFRRGDRIYDIAVHYSTEGDADAIVEKLAKLVEARLKASPSPAPE